MVKFDRTSFDQKDIDHIYDWTDSHFRAGDFATVDLWISWMDVKHERMSVHKMLAVLTATLPARSKLSNRPAFFSAVEEELKIRGQTQPDLLDPDLLKGLGNL